MIAKRLSALVVAIALVAGAFVARNRLDDKAELDRKPLRVACAAELGQACDRLRESGYDVVVEDALVTARRLALAPPGDLATELWLTLQPSAALVERGRSPSAPPLIRRNAITAVATSELALVVWNDRAAVLRKTCAVVTLRCVGEVAGRGAWAASGGRPEWGQVRVALADPEQTSTGLLTLGAGAESWFGRSDVGTNDFDADPAFGDWLAGLRRASPRDGSLQRMLATGRAGFDMAIVPRALAEEQARGVTDLVTLSLTPATRATAVAVELPGSRGRADQITSALKWERTKIGGPAVAADVLEALSLRWRELSR